MYVLNKVRVWFCSWIKPQKVPDTRRARETRDVTPYDYNKSHEDMAFEALDEKLNGERNT